MGGWLNALLVQEGVLFSPSASGAPSQFTAPTDALAAIKINSHSATQSVPIVDINNASTLAAGSVSGEVIIRGKGTFDSVWFGNVMLRIDSELGSAASIMLTSRQVPGTISFLQHDNTGALQIGNTPDNFTTFAQIKLSATGDVKLAPDFAAGKLAFFGGSSAFAGTVKATVAGSKGANAALASLMTALAGYGLVTDTTT